MGADKVDPKLDAPPAGLSPSTARLADILARHERALGTRTPGLADTATEHWTFVLAGQPGTETLERAGTNYRSHIERGPLVEEFGQLNGKRWHKDFNGIVSPMTDSDDFSFAGSRILEDAADPKNDVTVAGETAAAPRDYVLQVKRPGEKHPEWLFFDETTGDIVRAEFVQDKRRYTSAYDDFRTTAGMRRAWHVHDSDGRAQIDLDWHRVSLDAGKPIPAPRFAQPASNATVVEGLLQRANIPAKFHYGMIVVRLSVQGRGLDFIVDSGSKVSVIDRDVAADLGLPTYGQVTKLDDGTKYGYDTKIADATVGPIRLQNFAVRAEEYSYDANQDIKIVGVLGYDFLAANAFKMDFVNSSLDVIPAKDFTAPDGALPADMELDDGVPLVSMYIGENVAKRVVFDTDEPYTMVFGSYIDAHPADFTDLKGKHHTRVAPFADDRSNAFGQSLEVWIDQVSHLQLSLADYRTFPVVVTNFPYSLGGDDVDAIVGEDFYTFYDVYFDYPHDRIYLKPNDYFFKTFKKNT
jgi:hypothetical protein